MDTESQETIEGPVTDFDHHGAEFAGDPYGVAKDLVQRCPVSRTEAHGGYWVISDHQNVSTAFRDYQAFSSASGATIPDLSFGTTHIPVTVDPPQQQVYRRFLTPTFAKDGIAYLEPDIESFVRTLVEGLKARESWDFMEDFAAVVPGTVILMLLGVAPERRIEFSNAMQRGLTNVSADDPEMKAAIEGDRMWMVDQIKAEIAVRRERASEDLMSKLVREPLGDGRLLTDAEIIDIVMVLFVAGFHTTNSALGSIVMHLFKVPEDRQRLIDDPDLIPQAIEEIIRVYAPATGMARTLTRDLEFGGAHMREGDKAYLFIMAANRDEQMFQDADRIDFDRQVKSGGGLAWGWGVHRCMGIHLARLLLKIEVETILELIPDYVIDLDAAALSSELGIAYVYDTVPAHLPLATSADLVSIHK